VAASARLVEVLLAAGEAAPDAAAPLADGALRHLSIRPAGQAAVTTPPPSWLSWLGLVPEVGGEQQLRIGERSLVIAPKPGSEIDERLGDTVRLLITLLLFSGASLLVAWFAADRALAPVRGLEAGLERLARGEADPALPPSRCASSRGSPAPSSASPPSCRRLAPPSAPSPAS
jgi:two-component system sensor histidine kinase UhpB